MRQRRAVAHKESEWSGLACRRLARGIANPMNQPGARRCGRENGTFPSAAQNKNRLDENAERKIHEHRSGGNWKRHATDRRQPRAHNVSADRRRRNKRADRFADPAHPKKSEHRRTIRVRKKDPPRNRVEKYWDEMVNDDSHNRPFAGGKRSEDLADALMNQQSREQRSAGKAKQPYGYLNFARRFHCFFQTNSGAHESMRLWQHEKPTLGADLR